MCLSCKRKRMQQFRFLRCCCCFDTSYKSQESKHDAHVPHSTAESIDKQTEEKENGLEQRKVGNKMSRRSSSIQMNHDVELGLQVLLGKTRRHSMASFNYNSNLSEHRTSCLKSSWTIDDLMMKSMLGQDEKSPSYSSSSSAYL